MDSLLKLLEDHPLVDGDEQRHYSYGTAGFRYKAELMEGIVLRVGVCCALLLGDEDMGIMLTASHNDESYNGVKVSNPDGSMIDETQESFLVDFVNQRNSEEWKAMLATKKQQFREQQRPAASPVQLHIGRDTRSHSPSLAKLIVQGAQETMKFLQDSVELRLQVNDHGILTTPMLHHIVLHSNPQHLPALLHPPRPSRAGYVDWLAEAYCDLIGDADTAANDLPRLQIDCACGVGYDAVKQVNDAIHDLCGVTRLQGWNGPSDGPLNTLCGSEHVQKQLQLPTWYGPNKPDRADGISYGCSLDGDADRIVFFFSSQDNQSTLLDGDKIAILIAHFFKQLHLPDSLTMGVVQTAYANGASTEYLRSTLQIPVIITKTGVKHLHHAAVHNFDVGIYFEANGHGTVIFGPKFHEEISKIAGTREGDTWGKVAKLINPAVGDAVSDLLFVDAMLQFLGWSSSSLDDNWNALYKDLPSRQIKVAVKDRSVVKCNDNETKCLEPASLQPALDGLMSNKAGYRTFVRASGTENVVRVYAEAPTRDEADKLASAAAQLVQQHCGGVDPVSSI